MQELGIFNCKTNVIPNKLEKYKSFNINYDSSQFLDSFFYNLIKNLDKNDFTYLSQEFHSKEKKTSQAKMILSI